MKQIGAHHGILAGAKLLKKGAKKGETMKTGEKLKEFGIKVD